MDKPKTTYHQRHCQSHNNNPQQSVKESNKIDRSRKQLFSNYSGSNKSYNSQDLLKLQINVLKRQNAFLKKKIDDLVKQKKQLLLDGFGLVQYKKKPYPKKGPMRDNRDGVQISVDYFFKEINNLINSVADVFQLQLNQGQQIQYQHKNNSIIKYPPLKSPIIKKQVLYKKLQMIMLEAEPKKYTLLLDIFNDYYKVKTQVDNQTIRYVDYLTDKTLELNGWMLSKIRQQNDKKKLKSQYSQMSKQVNDDIQMPNRRTSIVDILEFKKDLIPKINILRRR